MRCPILQEGRASGGRLRGFGEKRTRCAHGGFFSPSLPHTHTHACARAHTHLLEQIQGLHKLFLIHVPVLRPRPPPPTVVPSHTSSTAASPTSASSIGKYINHSSAYALCARAPTRPRARAGAFCCSNAPFCSNAPGEQCGLERGTRGLLCIPCIPRARGGPPDAAYVPIPPGYEHQEGTSPPHPGTSPGQRGGYKSRHLVDIHGAEDRHPRTCPRHGRQRSGRLRQA